MTGLGKLAEEVRQTQEAQLEDSARRVAVRNRLLARHRPRRRVPVWAGGAAALAAAAAVVFALLPDGEAPLTFSAAAEPAQVGDFLAAPHAETLPLTFSDGSTVELAPQSRARVHGLSERGAQLQLEQGTAKVDVVHRDDTQWSVKSGPYTVHVVGTRFSVGWDARSQRFSLDMEEGQVRVEGPGIAARTVRAGEQLTLDPARVATSEPIVVEAVAPTAEDPSALLRVDEPAPEPVEPTSIESPQDRRVDLVAFRSRAADAHYGDAVTGLGGNGFNQIVQAGSMSDLEKLADAARRTHDQRAPQAYRALRSRFGGTRPAVDASFHLGRYHFHANRSELAQRWLQTYLRESPNGPWAREALGRLLELHDRGGDTAQTQRLAAEYLRRFPHGPHADFAANRTSTR